jgi:hypothetical protein
MLEMLLTLRSIQRNVWGLLLVKALRVAEKPRLRSTRWL